MLSTNLCSTPSPARSISVHEVGLANGKLGDSCCRNRKRKHKQLDEFPLEMSDGQAEPPQPYKNLQMNDSIAQTAEGTDVNGNQSIAARLHPALLWPGQKNLVREKLSFR